MTFDVCVSGQAKQDMGDIYDYIYNNGYQAKDGAELKQRLRT